MTKNISLDAVQNILNDVLENYREAVNLLKATTEGLTTQQELKDFLAKVGVRSEEEVQADRTSEARALKCRAIVLLNGAGEPLPGIHYREWNDTVIYLRKAIEAISSDKLMTIVKREAGGTMDMYLVGQAMNLWQNIARKTSILPIQQPGVLERGKMIELVIALLRELRQ